ncbi:MAG: DMT family transporter [Gemmatimonadota bacterium]|nr:DMT family transporter [Gemmatimonadota bacterium]
MNDQPEGIATDVGLVSVALIWGVNFAVMKVVLAEIDPLALNALRFPLAAVALAIVLRRFPGPTLPDPSDRIRVLSLGLVGNVAYQLCFIFGLDWTLAGNASLLLATTPTWTLVLSIAVGHERATIGAILGVVVTLSGVAMVVLGRGDALAVGGETLAGDALMLVAAVLWAFYTVAGRGPALRYGSLRMTSWTLWVGTPVLVLLGAPSVAAANLSEVSAGAWVGIVYAGLLSIGVAYVLWYRGVRRLGNSRTAVYSNLVPVTALLVAWLWLGEVPTPLQLSGAAVILAGLTLARVAQSPGSSLPWASIPAARSDEVN